MRIAIAMDRLIEGLLSEAHTSSDTAVRDLCV